MREVEGSILFRIITALSLAMAVSLMIWAVGLGYLQRQTLQASFQDRGVRVVGPFPQSGAAAILDNLFRIQEAMSEYKQDPDLRLLEVVDSGEYDHCLMQEEMIGDLVDDRLWTESESDQGRKGDFPKHCPMGDMLIVVEPLQGWGMKLQRGCELAFLLIEFKKKSVDHVRHYLGGPCRHGNRRGCRENGISTVGSLASKGHWDWMPWPR